VHQPYSGGAGNGESGLVSWHQELAGPGQGNHLRLRKTLFIHRGVFLCL
jgi:hypothetical protein